MPIQEPTPSKHVWKFFRAGGFDQVRLESGADLMNLDKLDQKLWVALACPVSGLEFDKTTLQLIDADKDGRVRVPELITAVKWAGSILKNPQDLLKGSPTLRVDAVNEETPEGKRIVNFAKQILGKKEGDEITIAEAVEAANTFAAKPLNGDGVIPPETAEDEETKSVINDIMACLGADTDVSGKPGVRQPRVDQFFTDAVAYSDWWKRIEEDITVVPLGVETPAAVRAIETVRGKIDDFFARSRLALFDSRALGALNREEKEYLTLAAKDLSITSAEIMCFPLARIHPGGSLPLGEGLNPAWIDAMALFSHNAVKPLLGKRTELTESEWVALKAKIAPYQAVMQQKTGLSVEKLGIVRVRQILAGNSMTRLSALIARDKGEEANSRAVVELHKLIHYHRDLVQLCHNFVSFRDFYGRKVKAIFQAGTLYLDQRSCDLCLTVEDSGRHATMAGLAGAYLAYCDCVRKATGEKLQIVAAFTAGDADNLMVGRNGVFYDRKGRDWDATITKIVDNPISIRQAFWAPYKKIVRMIDELIAKRAAAAEDESITKIETYATSAAAADKSKLAVKPKFDVGIVAALGVATSALTTTFALVLGFFKDLPIWRVPLVILAIMLVVSTPSMLIAWLKLRRRNLGPILDANGWAVNAKAKMNVPFGGSLTQVAALPVGSERNLIDPYAEKKNPWPAIIVIVILLIMGLSIANENGYLYKFIGIGTRVEGVDKRGAGGNTNTVNSVNATNKVIAAESK